MEQALVLVTHAPIVLYRSRLARRNNAIWRSKMANPARTHAGQPAGRQVNRAVGPACPGGAAHAAAGAALSLRFPQIISIFSNNFLEGDICSDFSPIFLKGQPKDDLFFHFSRIYL